MSDQSRGHAPARKRVARGTLRLASSLAIHPGAATAASMPAAGSCVIVDEVRDGLASWKTAAAIGDLGAAEIEILGDAIAT